MAQAVSIWWRIKAAGLGNVVTIEGIPGTSAGVDYAAYRLADGEIVVPEAPGWGMALDPAATKPNPRAAR